MQGNFEVTVEKAALVTANLDSTTRQLDGQVAKSGTAPYERLLTEQSQSHFNSYSGIGDSKTVNSS